MKETANRLRCFLIGETSLLIQCAQHLLDHHFTIVGISSPDIAVKTWAKEQNIPTVHPLNITTLQETPFDFLFSIVNSAILSDEILTLPTRYALNYHDAPLPKYAGLNATTWAIINQEKQHGITWHIMSQQIDAGDILKQVTFDVADDETSLTLNAKCYQAASQAFAELIVELSEGRETCTAQNLAERTYFDLTKRPPAGGVLSWFASAQSLVALTRALDFGPYPNPLGLPKLYMGNFPDKPGFLVVRQAQLLPQESQQPAGTVIAHTDKTLTLATNSQDLALSHFFTLEGHVLTVPQFVATYHIKPGYCFPALPSDVVQQLEQQGVNLAKHERFWVNRLASLQVARIPYAHSQTASSSPEFRTIRQPLPWLAELESLADTIFQKDDHDQAGGIKNTALTLTAFVVYLARLNNIDFGSETTTQHRVDLGLDVTTTLTGPPLTEFFASCVPARFSLDLAQSFTETCLSVWDDYQRTTQRQTYARDLTLRYPELTEQAETSSTFATAISLGDAILSSKHDLTLLIPNDTQTTNQLGLHYNRQIFDDETAMCILAQILHLLQLLVTNPDKPLAAHTLLPPTEHQQLLIDWNNTATPYPDQYCIHQLFEAQVTQTPTATALVFENQHLTYVELNARANQLAHYLQSLDVGSGTVVGICADYSVEMVVGLLGILKTGVAYTPLDPNYPPERLATMVSQAQIPILLTQAHLKDRLPNTQAKTIVLDEDWTEIAAFPSHNLPSLTSSVDDLIYVLFTSGSTGNPKGAGVYHRSFTNLAHWFVNDLGLQPQDKCLLISSISFDLTQKNIYAPLICGGTLHLVDMPVFDPQQIRQAIDRYHITWVNCTPSTFYAVIDSTESANSLSSLRYVVLGGEPIAISRLRPWLSQPNTIAKIVNTYGPTECTDICASFIVDDPEQFKDDSIPLGRPINNVSLYIVDPHLQPVPLGCVGELCIAGVSVGLGYIGHPALTAEKFVANPFVSKGAGGQGGRGARAQGRKDAEAQGRRVAEVQLPITNNQLQNSSNPNAPRPTHHAPRSTSHVPRLYKTGDLAHYLPDGNIEFLGRIDHQVKIRGFRVELGEIESTLQQHAAVKEAVVVMQEQPIDNQQLVAYVVLHASPASPQGQALSAKLRQFLQTTLPDHMLPTAYVSLPVLPLTPNGKVDRNALPQPTYYARPQGDYVAPQTGLESDLAEIWQSILQIDQIGITDNFFELGGHSLLLSRIHRQLQQTLNLSVSMVDLFRYPTLRALSQHLADAQTEHVLKRRTPHNASTQDDIAIVGMAGRFPGASTLEAFWQNLCEGRESITFFTDDDLLQAGVDPDLFNQPNYIKAGGVLTDIDLFDADFFSISTPEAEILDPQIRLFMECAWEALEHAGCDPQSFTGDIGLYAGAGMNTYLTHLAGGNPQLTAQHFTNSVGAFQAVLANDKDFLATRVAYKLNLSGPALTVQSACSTSLVAVHLARQALLNGECDMALAGGVAVRIPHQAGYIYQEGMVFSPDGHCRAFDAQAQGMVMGHGLGLVVLKRLTDAQADGDVIHAIIKGSAINNDGAAKVGYTAPGVNGQIRVITEAQANAGIDPETITYIETHGTGTKLGDPIEIAALSEVFRDYARPQSCALGAVKTNIGHLDIASGVAGLIKAVLALKHQAIPPTVHYQSPNPQLNLAETPFYINPDLQPWQPVDLPRRAGVSSFGIGGTNAHLILEEAPTRSNEQFAMNNKPEGGYLLTLSAKSEIALLAMAQQYSDFFDTRLALNMAEVCYTSQIGRTHFQYRLAIVADTQAAIQEALISYIAKKETSGLFTSQNPPPRPTGDLDYSQQPQALQHLAALYVHGKIIDWPAVYQAQDDLLLAQQKPVIPRRKTSLPTYPFQRQRYWVDHPEQQSVSKQTVPSLVTWQRLCPQTLPVETVTSPQAKVWLTNLWQGEQAMLAKLQLPLHIDLSMGGLMPEGLLHTCLQVSGLAGGCDSLDNPVWQPVDLGALHMHQTITGKTWWCYATSNKDNTQNFQLVDSNGQLLIDAQNLQLQPVQKPTKIGDANWQNWLYAITWPEQPLFGLPPAYLSVLDEVVSNDDLPHDLEPTQLAQHLTAMDQLDSLVVDYILLAFNQAGVIFKAGQTWTTDRLGQALGVTSPYRRLLSRLLQILTDAEILVDHKAVWQVQQTPPQSLNPQKRLVSLTQQYETVAQAELTLLQRCGPYLSDVLQGRQNPLELLYPRGDTDIVLQMHREPELYLLTCQLQQAVETIIKQLPPNRGLQILEIGAGSGSTTQLLLPQLPAEQIVYTFTDISSMFVERAKEKFNQYPFVEYHTLDIEHAPASQGFKPHHYDLVIATNVLHATEDLKQSVAHVRQLLTPEGLFILLEDTTPRPWVDITFGLTEGWWRFTDTRTDHPLISVEQWQALLAESGFQHIDIPSAHADLGRTLFLAQADATPEAMVGQTLIFTDATALNLGQTYGLANQGDSPIVVHKSDTYQQADAYTFYLRPDSADDYQRLLQTIPTIATVIYLWALADADEHVDDLIQLPDVAEQNCMAVLRLVQALIQSNHTPKLWLITQGVIPITQVDMADIDSHISNTSLSQSPLWGLGKVVALEQPDLWGGLIDLPSNISTTEAAQAVAMLRDEVSNPSQPIEDHIAIRQGKRYVARLTPTPAPLTKLDSLTFEPESTYLITGGWGYLGLQFARWLVEQGVHHIVLVSRSQPLPAVEQTLETLREKLRDSGGTLLIQQADVASQPQLAQVMDACQQLPPLRGVIHAAGITHSRKIEAITAEDVAALFEARVHGAWLLHSLTREMSLDHFICFSSAGSVWGAEGQAHYDAASHFVDSLAHYRQGLGLPALTINWGMVAGPRLADNAYFQWLTKIGMQDIPVTAACQAVAHLLTAGTAQTVVANMDWQTFKPIYQWRNERPLFNNITTNTAEPSPVMARSTVENGAEKPTSLYQTDLSPEKQLSSITIYLEDALIKLLRLSHTPDHRQGFFEMGLDSLMTIELRNQINEAIGLDLPLDTLLKNDTIEALATLLYARLETIPHPSHHADPPAQDTAPPSETWIEVIL